MDRFERIYSCEPKEFGFQDYPDLLDSLLLGKTIKSNNNSKICICCQMGNAKLWATIADRLVKIVSVHDVDLYFSYNDPTLFEIISDTFPNAVTILTENRGMDIGGFLKTLEYIFDHKKNYDFLCKIHSKTSDGWRNVMFDHTLTRMFEHIDRMNRESHINMIGIDPCKYDFLNMNHVLDYVRKYDIDHHFPTGYEQLINKDNKQIKHLIYRKGMIRKTKYRFVSGTVFVCRFKVFNDHKSIVKAYRDLSEGYVRDVEFQKPEHALERVFGIMAGENGLVG